MIRTAKDSEADRSTEEDHAWVSIDTPLSLPDLRRLLDEPERLIRINPLLVFERFERVADDRYQVCAKNLSNDRELATELIVTHEAEGLDVRYTSGIKILTRFRAESRNGASRLIVTDIYAPLPEAERRARVDEVDLSLNAWGRALHQYLHHWARWQWLPPWRWYMESVWQPMTPSARRVVFLILAISVFEIVTFAVVVVVWMVMSRST